MNCILKKQPIHMSAQSIVKIILPVHKGVNIKKFESYRLSI